MKISQEALKPWASKQGFKIRIERSNSSSGRCSCIFLYSDAFAKLPEWIPSHRFFVLFMKLSTIVKLVCSRHGIHVSKKDEDLSVCHGQTRQEQESEGNVWFIVKCRLRNKRGKDPSYLSYVGKRMKWRQNISGAGSGAETWVGLVLAPGS